MRPVRWLVRLCLVALGVAVLAGPAGAQSVNRAVIDDLNEQLLYVALPLALFVEITLIYAVYRFRDNDDPEPTVDDPALEITWTVATGVILVFVGVSAYFVLTNPFITPVDAGAADPADGNATDELEVEVLAYQWGWEFRYPEENVTTQSRVVVPVDTDVRFVLSSADVVHSFYVPKLGLKQDAFPGHETVVRTHATRTGEYRLHCAELCGARHAFMNGTVDVRNGSEYRAWLDRRASGASG